MTDLELEAHENGVDPSAIFGVRFQPTVYRFVNFLKELILDVDGIAK